MRQFEISVAFSLIISIVSAQLGDSRIQFSNDPAQTSNQASGLTTLYAQPTGSQSKGAQIIYKQLAKDAAEAPLVTVYLVNSHHNIKLQLQSGFDTVSQTCSCYYVQTGVMQANKLPSSSHYRVQFFGPAQTGRAAMNLVSGEFGMFWNTDSPEGEIKDVAPPPVQMPVVIRDPIRLTNGANSGVNLPSGGSVTEANVTNVKNSSSVVENNGTSPAPFKKSTGASTLPTLLGIIILSILIFM